MGRIADLEEKLEERRAQALEKVRENTQLRAELNQVTDERDRANDTVQALKDELMELTRSHARMEGRLARMQEEELTTEVVHKQKPAVLRMDRDHGEYHGSFDPNMGAYRTHTNWWNR